VNTKQCHYSTTDPFIVEVNAVGNGVDFTAYDGNGNVAALVSTVGGTNSAQYEYGPFGEVIRSTGPMARSNPFRFSTKFQDDETDLVYYPPTRYCIPSTGRWTSRDPVNEQGFILLLATEDLDEAPNPVDEGNSYGFVNNNPISLIDLLGLLQYSVIASNYPLPSVYPTPISDTHSIWKLVGGNVQKNAEGGAWGREPNSCAVRMSHALNASGVMVKFVKGGTVSGKTPPKWWYYFRVANLKRFINSQFSNKVTYTPTEFKKLCNKKGIVVLNIHFRNATGHADLWDGTHMIDGDDAYIDISTTIDFWELEEDKK